jgi:hypothetical protein
LANIIIEDARICGGLKIVDEMETREAHRKSGIELSVMSKEFKNIDIFRLILAYLIVIF